MALPPCFPLINLTLFSDFKKSLADVHSAHELQDLVNSIFAEISLLESTIQSQINDLTNLTVLLSIPTNLAEAITWITNFVNDFLGPILKPLLTMEAQLVAYAAQVLDLIAAINEIAAAKFPGITINIPTISIICEL